MRNKYIKDEQANKLVSVACAYADTSRNRVASEAGFGTAQNFHKRLSTGHLAIIEWQNIAKALGAKFEIGFVFPDGKKIEL